MDNKSYMHKDFTTRKRTASVVGIERGEGMLMRQMRMLSLEAILVSPYLSPAGHPLEKKGT